MKDDKNKQVFITPDELVERWRHTKKKERLQVMRFINKKTGLGSGPLPTKIGPARTDAVLYRLDGPKGVEAYERGEYTHWDVDGNIFKNGEQVGE